ncbi:hypothetical protein Taro_021949 [Colocasia esculenta]|uniref:Uncharacterized protein n=1 Tax=Colocasia esculenta TaxID=4460 RepID=A0A843V0G5_COLES|nr:hypothetical protein [Colocasia esculenta]
MVVSRCPSPSRWYRDRLWGCDITCVASGVSVAPLFEFIAYLTGLNFNPSGSSDPWVAVRPSGSLAGVREVTPSWSCPGGGARRVVSV